MLVIILSHVHVLFYTVEERPTMKQLQDVMRHKNINMTSRWRDLGYQLIENTETLKAIEADRNHSDIDARCQKMFEKWLELTPNASWNQLIDSLNNIEMRTAATQLRDYFSQVIS